MDESVNLIKDLVQKIHSHPGYECVKVEVNTDFYRFFGILVYEIEFENLQQYKKVSEDVECLLDFQEFLKTWATLINGGGVNEIWEVC